MIILAATGIKTLGSHYDIVAYANIRGYAITLAEWGRYLAMDWLQTSDADLASRSPGRSSPLVLGVPSIVPLACAVDGWC